MAVWLWMKSTKITLFDILACLTQILNNDNSKYFTSEKRIMYLERS